MSYLKVFPRWEYLLLILGLVMFCAGAMAQTQTVTVVYRWTPPTTYNNDPAQLLAASDITGYEIKLNSGTAQLASSVTSYSKTYTLASGACITDIAQVHAKAAIWGLWSDPVTINLCPPSKLILQWSATVVLTPSP